MSGMDLQFSDIYGKVGDFLGVGSSPTGSDLTKVKDIVYRAYRQFLYPTDLRGNKRHLWDFMKKRYVINISSSTYKYTLPSDFDRMVEEPTFGTNSSYPPLVKRSCFDIDRQRSISEVSSYPYWYALNPIRVGVDQTPMWELWIWPKPNGNYEIKFVYQIKATKPTADTDYFLGGPEGNEVLLQMALAVAEQQEDAMATSHHTQLAREMLQGMIVGDTVGVPDTLGRTLSGPKFNRVRGFTSIQEGRIYADDA